MEADVFKPFIGKNVEVLIGGQWICGKLQLFPKGIAAVLPIGAETAFYGIAKMEMKDIIAIREVITQDKAKEAFNNAPDPVPTKSSLEIANVARFLIDRKGNER